MNQDLVYGGYYPFWFWNDRLEKDKISSQVNSMAQQGIEGFFIHPRQGMKQPYLSQNYFAMVDTAVEEARKKELDVCLYDEFPYPSGVAGGEVILGNPHFQATYLRHKKYEVEGGKIKLELPPGNIMSAKAYPLKEDNVVWENEIDLQKDIGLVLTEETYEETGLTNYNRKRFFASKPLPVLETELDAEFDYVLYVSVQCQVEKHKYWDKYTDVLNPRAVQYFMELTHERYRKRYSSEFGNVIKAIFTDEVFPNWSERIPRKFKEEYGYDLRENMAALQEKTHPDHQQVTHDLNRLKYNLFVESFEQPVKDWCQENNLAYCGEKPVFRLSQLKFMDIPGCDPGHTKAGAKLDMFRASIRGNARAVASAAYFYEKKGSLCECYHSLGWSGTIQDAKIIAEGLLLAGISYLVPHGFFYSTHSLKKHDAPPSFFEQMPYWPLFGQLSERLKKIGDYFNGTYLDADVLVYAPHSGNPDSRQLEVYESLLQILLDNNIDFHLVDTDILKRAVVNSGKINIKDISAEMLIIPPLNYIEDDLSALLSSFKSQACNVFTLNKEKTIDQIREYIGKNITPELEISSADSDNLTGVYSVKRCQGQQTFWFILNTNSQEYELNLKPDGDFKLQELFFSEQPVKLKETENGYLRRLAPYESFLLKKENKSFVTRKEKSSDSEQVLTIPVQGEMNLNLLDKNLVRMYNWKMSLLDESGNVRQANEVPAVPLNEQLARGEFEFEPRQSKNFGSEVELDFPRMFLNYEFKFRCEYEGKIELVVEPGSIKGDWTIQINDSPAFSRPDLNETSTHVEGSLGLDISRWVQDGVNSIKIDVKTEKGNQGLLNPLYLAGDFGVALNPLTLVENKETAFFENYRENLIPYYSGVIEYETKIHLKEVPQRENIYIYPDFPEHFNQAVEISFNNHEFVSLPWQPRVFSIPRSHLKAGENKVVFRVYTTLIRSFEGTRFDYRDHVYRPVAKND